MLVLVVFVLISVSSEPLFDINDPAFIKACVDEHNLHRSSVQPTAANMRYMSWDAALAATAQAWARFCWYKHNIHLGDVRRVHPTFSSVGENIWAGTSYQSVHPAISLWVEEVKDYDYNSNKCVSDKVCGHYTQVVWADSYKVGCAAQACPNGVSNTHFSDRPGVIFVCNYATAGNFRGVAPYKQGVSCSGCKQERCEHNLCHNTTRDAPQRYNWTPDWDPALSTCGSFCLAVLSIRLVSVPLLFVCVCVLQRYYNLFAYE